MSGSSRVKNSKTNLIYGMFSQSLSIILNFVVRVVFIKFMSASYLGINGLFSNVLSILSLSELGFGNAMVYNLYKPLALKDEEKIKSLMSFYSKVYKIIGLVVAVLGLILIPFLKYIIKDIDSVQNVYIIYVLFLVDSAGSYFFTYKRAILSADQKEYIASKFRFLFVCIRSVCQILMIIVFKQFIPYLIVKIVCTILENFSISGKVTRLYPYLKEEAKALDNKTITSMKDDVSALMLSKIANIALHGTDNIIISTFVGLGAVGILSNYTLISSSLTTILSIVSSAILGSLGNYIATENLESQYIMFKKIDYMYFNIYAFCFLCMFNLYNPFINLFFGKEYLFELSIVFVFCLNFLLEGLLQSFWNFRNTMGLFTQGRYRPVFSAVINIVFSIVLANYFGIIGVLIGTTLSRVLVNVWYDPYIIFKHGLKRSPKKYFMNYIYKLVLLFLFTFINFIITNFIFDGIDNIIKFFCLVIITVFSSIIMLILPFRKSEEFKYFKNLILNVIKHN